MAVDIKLKRSSVPGKIPTTASLELGEIALNTYDGKAYMKKQVGNVQSIIEIGSGSGGGGGVTSVSVTSANGFAGTVANPTTTPAITILTSVVGIMKGNGSAASAAVAGTDYITPTQGTASWALNAVNAITASYFSGSIANAITASYALTATSASYASSSTSASYANTSVSASYANNATSASYANNATSASYAQNATTASYAQNTISASYASSSTSASYAVNATSASYANNATSASYALTTISASYASSSTSASYAFQATSASYAVSAAYAPPPVSVSYAETASYAGNFTVAGTITAQTLVVQVITSSQELITGSLIVSGSLNAYGGVTGSLLGTASWANNATSASYALTSTSASYAVNATSASYALFATSASYASASTSASYASSSTSASYSLTATSASYSNNSTSASYANTATSASYSLNSTSASYAVTSSYAIYAQTASYAVNLIVSGGLTDVDYIDFDLTASFAAALGRLGYDSGEGTLQFGIAGGNVTLNIGEDLYQYVYNAETASMTKGQVVYISGSQGNRIAVKLASATNEYGSANTLGFVAETIAAGAEGWVMTEGNLRKLNTVGLIGGELLYLGTTPGTYTQTPPIAPNHGVRLGYAERIDNTVGSIYVKIDNGYELGELHNVVDSSNTGSYGDLFIKSGSVWINSRQLTGSYGLTGSLTSTNGGFTGSLLGTASYALFAISASYASASTSSSYASASTSASYALNAGNASTIDVFVFGSNVESYLLMSNVAGTTGVAIGGDADLRYNASTNKLTVGSVSATSLTGSLFGTASYADIATSASYASASTSASYASASTSASYAQSATSASFATQANSAFTASSADNFLVRGTLTAQTIVVQTITSSISIVTGSMTVSGSLTVLQGITGSLFGTSSWANNATSASYALNATSASYALNATSASYVNTLNQNVLITGSLTVGAATAGSNENTLILGPKGTNEGGQLLLQSGTSYTSASMLDIYADTGTGDQYIRILRGSNAGSDALVAQFNLHTKQFNLPAYTSATSFTGTPTAYLAVTNTGAVITTSGSGGSGLTGGSANYIARWASSILLTTGSLWDNGTSVGVGNQAPSYKLDVSGDIRATGAVYANANGTMYFRGGDDSELWDINVANTIGIYGQQDQTVASIKLGSGGGTISGYSGNIGIATTTASLARLQIQGNVSASSYTGSLFGTASRADNATSASYALTATTASYALTATSASYSNNSTSASYANNATSASYANTAGVALSGTGSFTGSFNGAHTGSLLGTASWANNATTSSYALTSTSASYALNATTASYALVATSASYSQNSTSASYALNSTSASYALTASYVPSVSGTTNYVAKFTAANTVGNSVIYDNGTNVGIGTTNPIEALFVYRSSGDASATFKTLNGGSELNLDATNGYAAVKIYSSGSEKWRIGQVNDSNGFTLWQSGAGTRVYVNTAGNVGIATTTPYQRLQVNGNMMLNSYYTTGEYGGLFFREGFTFNVGVGLKDWTDGGGSPDGLLISGYDGIGFMTFANEYTSSYVRMFIERGGNVGIGILSPSAKLHVSGGSSAQFKIEGTEADLWLTSNGGGSGSWRILGSTGDTTKRFRIYDNDNARDVFNIYNNGNPIFPYGSVGIGTTTPFSKLHVYQGNFMLSNTYGIFLNDNDGNWKIYKSSAADFTRSLATGSTININAHYGTGEGFAIGANGQNSYYEILGSGPTHFFRGNVGINTSTPGATLDVEGNLLVRNAQFEATSSATSGATTIATIATGSYRAAFVDYVAVNGSNQRAGTFMATWNGSTVQFTDYSTVDIGTTSAVTMSAIISGGNALIQATTPASWTVTATYRTI